MNIWRRKYSSDAVLKKVTELSKLEILIIEDEYAKKVKTIEDVFIIKPDQKFLEFAREFDKSRGKQY